MNYSINYANELLQKLFNDTIFLIEQEEYAREGIEWQNLEYIDNQNVIDLISKKPHGLFHTLDAQCNYFYLLFFIFCYIYLLLLFFCRYAKS